MLSREVFVVGVARTAIGGFGSSLKDVPLSSLVESLSHLSGTVAKT